jgi:hypothetical protein
VRIAKISALLSAVWTMTCAVLIVGWQVIYWIHDGVWNVWSVSYVFTSLESNRRVTYVTASSDKLDAHRESVLEFLMEMPAIVPLLIAAALLLAFYLRLTIIEKRDSMN